MLRNTTLICISVVVASLFIIPAHTKIYYNQLMRINKYIASCTNLSRRKAEVLVLTGRIKIDSSPVIPVRRESGKHPAGIQSTAETVTNLATEVSPSDKVYLDDKLITPQRFVYYALNKPVGYTTTTSDPHAEKLITNLVPNDPPVFPIGRLDKDTSGLIFLTNDGDFAQKMTHPKYEKEKEYIFQTDRKLSEESLEKLRKGIELDDGITAPAKVKSLAKGWTLGSHSGPDQNLYSITIHEGRNRQIRRMIDAACAKVITLKRIRVGDFELGDLKEGKYQIFKPK